MSPLPRRILYLPQLRGGHGVLNKNRTRRGCCTEGPGEGWGVGSSSVHLRLGVPVAEPSWRLGGRAQLLCLLSHRLAPVRTVLLHLCGASGHREGGSKQAGSYRPPTLQARICVPGRTPLPVLGSLSRASGPLSSLTPSSRPMSDRASSRPAKSPPASWREGKGRRLECGDQEPWGQGST